MRFLDPDNIRRAFRDPITWAALAIDLIPIYAVIVLGWGAAPLVFLYWLENLVIGVMTILRMIAAGVGKGIVGGAQLIFFVPFFTVHYGMFCFGHGIFLAALQSEDFAGLGGADVVDQGPSFIGGEFVGLIGHAENSGSGCFHIHYADLCLQHIFVCLGLYRKTRICGRPTG